MQWNVEGDLKKGYSIRMNISKTTRTIAFPEFLYKIPVNTFFSKNRTIERAKIVKTNNRSRTATIEVKFKD